MANQLVVPQSEMVLEQMKHEIAQELGIEINPDMSARNAGRIGGEITKRLIALGQQQLQQ